jgi:hypothetical protein
LPAAGPVVRWDFGFEIGGWMMNKEASETVWLLLVAVFIYF